MRTILAIIACLFLAPALHAEITQADIIKTVQHLQERCHQADAAQTAAEHRLEVEEGHGRELQADIDSLVRHDQAQTEKSKSLQMENGKLKAKVWKLAWVISGAIGLVMGLILALFPFPFPARIYIPIIVGALTTGVGAFVIRYLGL